MIDFANMLPINNQVAYEALPTTPTSGIGRLQANNVDGIVVPKYNLQPQHSTTHSIARGAAAGPFYHQVALIV